MGAQCSLQLYLLEERVLIQNHRTVKLKGTPRITESNFLPMTKSFLLKACMYFYIFGLRLFIKHYFLFLMKRSLLDKFSIVYRTA